MDELESELVAKEDEVEAWRAEVEGVLLKINDAYKADYDDLDDAVDFLLEDSLED